MKRYVASTRFSAVSVRARAALCAAGLLGLLVACSSSAPPQAKPVAHASSVPAGFSEFRDPGRGYSIAVPSSWIQINVQSSNASTMFAKLLKQEPKFAQVFGSSLTSLAQQDMSLLAVGPAGTAANMVVTSGSGTLTAAQLGTVYSTELQPTYARAGIKVLSHQAATLDGYPALRVSITIAFSGKTVPETQFVAGVHNNAYVLTITGATPTLTNQIKGTVRFL